MAYPGRSVVVDPRGNITADAGDGEKVLAATIDLATLRDYRAQFPALADAKYVHKPAAVLKPGASP